MKETGALDAAWEYARGYYQDAGVEKDFEVLAEHAPSVFTGYMQMRSGLFAEPPEGALDRKAKELVILGIEISNRKTNPPPVAHTRKAMEAGASVREVAEVVGLCVMLGGMITYREAGRFVLQEAVRWAEEANERRGLAGDGER